jgi:hypothetical protein
MYEDDEQEPEQFPGQFPPEHSGMNLIKMVFWIAIALVALAVVKWMLESLW